MGLFSPFYFEVALNCGDYCANLPVTSMKTAGYRSACSLMCIIQLKFPLAQ